MASSPDTLSMALFCDFENVALGVRDAQYDKFDIKPVLERLLLKGSIVVKKAYCDWDRYKGFKSKMHEANFELIEIPHVRQSGKNSADIRLVVDALDLCYTKSHVNTFVIISGDSDFSPLVSKLRENAKTVIGVGVKQSTSDLLIANCDEFIFYDDLVREIQRAADQRAAHSAQRRRPDEDKPRKKDDIEVRRTQAVELAAETFDALMAERGDSGKIWASVLKEAIKRRRPDFSESYYGFRAFGNLLEEAQARGLMSFGRDEKSGAYVYRATGSISAEQEHLVQAADSLTFEATENTIADPDREEPSKQRGSGARREAPEGRRRGRQSRTAAQRSQADLPDDLVPESLPSTPFVVPAQGRSGFDPHAPENTASVFHNGSTDTAVGAALPDGSDSEIETGSGSSTKRATRAGRTTRKPRMPAASTSADAGDAGGGVADDAVSGAGARSNADADAGAKPNTNTRAKAKAGTRRGTPSAPATTTTLSGSSATASTPVAPRRDSADEAKTGPRKTVSRARRPRKTPVAPDAE